MADGLILFEEIPKRLNKALLTHIANDHIGDEIGQIDTIRDVEIIAVEAQKVFRRGEGAALVPLNEWMIPTDPDKERHGEHHRVSLAIVPVVYGLPQRTFQRPEVVFRLWPQGNAKGHDSLIFRCQALTCDEPSKMRRVDVSRGYFTLYGVYMIALKAPTRIMMLKICQPSYAMRLCVAKRVPEKGGW